MNLHYLLMSYSEGTTMPDSPTSQLSSPTRLCVLHLSTLRHLSQTVLLVTSFATSLGATFLPFLTPSQDE